ncbi:related to ribosomal protein L3 precursor, mitochondrial [Phialocephala subalpina]|uniref:Large ribosomal subunit protein uL3m n=1 Tax=Phialocephala subalpina TaxID=576137 RepID=A0A1L7WKK2_9HELO|nr:related to ribosomal protein L3 precursor, mitochondrial [Phialocephala subalpina]
MAPKLPTTWGAIQLPPSFLLPESLLPIIAKRGVKYGWTTAPARGKPNRFNQQTAGLPTLEHSPAAALKRKAFTLPLRTGALAVKKGMTAIYDPETGIRTPCTVLQVDRLQVVAHKTREKHGYYAVQMGSGWKHPSNVTRPVLGHFAGAGVSPKRYLTEFRVKDEKGLLKVGQSVGPEWFLEGQFVDTRSNCRGMGFAGGMKRHGFKGQPASHGNSKNHRTMGSSGPSQGGGSRVHPGKRMPGNMGGQQVTVQNVKVLKVDSEKGLIVVNGCVAGPKGCIVKVQDAIKKPWPVIPAALEGVKEALKETATA